MISDWKCCCVLYVQGQYLLRGSRMVDFDIRVGNAVCDPVSLSDSQIDCRPPRDRPDRDINDSSCPLEMLPLKASAYQHLRNVTRLTDCSAVGIVIMDARSAMRPCYILPMFLSSFYMAALVGQTAERIFTKLSHVVDITCYLRTY